MEIEFLYYEDCPSHDAALTRLEAVLAEEGVSVPVRVTKVETDAQAQALRFIGSPTIRMNGVDIDPPPADSYYALTCRAYRLANGRISPLPAVEMIRDAVRQAQTQ